MSRFFIDRPIFAAVVSILLTLLGALHGLLVHASEEVLLLLALLVCLCLFFQLDHPLVGLKHDPAVGNLKPKLKHSPCLVDCLAVHEGLNLYLLSFWYFRCQYYWWL